ncbi:MAG: M23 family metallopeptidase [Bacteroidetes bacterium]|nr:M23 family metallopeptidase [Bacteroidota bacterium]
MRVFQVILALLVFQFCRAQVADEEFGPPMKIPLLITAGFGEIRPNHFHSGLDFSTQGKSQEVIAAFEGCVSRIKVSLSGYGRALYLDHPNGYTTVYGHLSSFNPEIETYIIQMQAQALDYEIDVLVDSGRFCFKKGDVIAMSGNSGSSTAPHLHFEIRDKVVENVFNPLFFGYGRDKAAPEAFSVLLFPEEHSGTVNGSANMLRLPLLKSKSGKRYLSSKTPVPIVSGMVAFGLEGGDVIGKPGNYSGIYQLKVFVNEAEIFRSRMDEFSFDESRAVNAYIDYKSKKRYNKKYQKCFVPQNPLIGIYKSSANRGFYNFNRDTLYQIRLELSDFAGNTTSQSFQVKGRSGSGFYKYSPPEENYSRIPPTGGTIKKAGFKAVIGARCLYDTSDVKIIVHPQPGKYAPLVELGSIYIPLHSGIKLAFTPELKQTELREKLCIAQKSGNSWNVLSSTWHNDELQASTKTFGDFTVLIDTLPPVIRQIPVKKRHPQTRKYYVLSNEEAGEIKVKITDPVSENASWQAYLDEQFLIPQPAGKDTWVYKLPVQLNSGKHSFTIQARDEYNNESSFSLELNIP